MATASPQAAPRRARSARIRTRVLQVATELMARRGYSGTTISAISQAAGVMPASIYWHFGSKEGLLGAVIERAAEAWFTGAAAAMDQDETDGHQPPRAGLRYLFDEQAAFYRVLLLIGLERRDAGGPPLEAVTRVRARLRERLARRIESQLAIDDPDARRRTAQRLAGFGMVLLDGSFAARQLDGDPDGDGDAAIGQLSWGMALARAALLAELDRGGEA